MMAWGRLDDRLDDHPKFVGLSLAAVGMWTLCLTYAIRQGTGFIPAGLPARYEREGHAELGAVLVERGLWEPADGGWAIHDFDDYALPKHAEATEARRSKRAAAGRVGGQRSAQARRAAFGTAQPRSKPEANPKQMLPKQPEAPEAPPNPVPIPVGLTLPDGRDTGERELTGAAAVVAAYAEGCTEAGSSAMPRAKARAGAEGKRLLAAGKELGVVIEAAREAARRNAVHLIENIVGDIERARAGVSTARYQEPVPNPVSVGIQALRFHDQPRPRVVTV